MKKKIPLAILQAVQPIAVENKNHVTPVKDTNALFLLKDNDALSDFFFKISKQEIKEGKVRYLLEYRPKDKEQINMHSVFADIETIVQRLKDWISIVADYNEIQTVYDDPILNSYQQKFEKEFDIIDEDSDYAGFDLKQQLILDEYLNSVKVKLITFQEGRNDEEKNKLIEIETEVSQLQNDLTKETKRNVVKRLSKIWAKSQKLGLNIIKEIFVNVVADLTKRLLTGV